ncbi:MAG: alanine racemase [Bacillota bacterium]|nr:MAG: alanine racemase [Bacillota bacterium]
MSNYRPTWAEINLDYMWHNVLVVKSKLKQQNIIPVIKANAYGHGAKEVFQFLIRKGIDTFAVSLLEEALELRIINQDVKIIMMGAILNDQLEIASKHNIDITLYSSHIIRDILASTHPLNIHLKIDTGMHRYGLTDEHEILNVIHVLNNHPKHKLIGLYTHFATANENETYYLLQLDRFKNILTQIKQQPKMIHISNSSSALKYEKNYAFTTHIRYGISLYGLTLDEKVDDLKPVMSLKSKVVQIKQLKKDEYLGYGASYQAKKDERIAILPIGYADGFIRKNKKGYVEINKKLYKIVGIICMDACFIKVDETIHEGDTAILFGGLISTDDVAKRLNTINYEVTCQISSRVPRIYIEGGFYD